VTQQLLSSEEASEGALADIELFSLRAIPSGQRLDIRLDKMTGTPPRPARPLVCRLERLPAGRVQGRHPQCFSLLHRGNCRKGKSYISFLAAVPQHGLAATTARRS
jgi:hypothetical protein